jgi:ABC-type amino acid transport substrate-binding protein
MRSALLAALLLIPTLTPAIAADAPDPVADAMHMSGGAVSFLPKPWPMKALVKPGQLTVTVTGEAPPGDFVDPKTGELTGFAHDLFLKLGADLGLPVEFVKLPFVSSLPGLKANRFDLACASAAWTTQRLATDDFTMSSPIALSGLIGLTLKDSGITGWDSTKGRRMGGVQGEIYLQDARKHLPEAGTVTEFPGSPELGLALQNKQIDFLVTNSTIIRFILANAPNAAELRVIGPPLEIYPGGLCINSREGDLVKAVNALLGNYRADGTLKAIFATYGVPTSIVDQLKEIGY